MTGSSGTLVSPYYQTLNVRKLVSRQISHCHDKQNKKSLVGRGLVSRSDKARSIVNQIKISKKVLSTYLKGVDMYRQLGDGHRSRHSLKIV